jgi:hypothetical protein
MIAKQVLKDQRGLPLGFFISKQAWESIVLRYPDIDSLDTDVPQWEKDFIDMRLSLAHRHPESLRPIEELLEAF